MKEKVVLSNIRLNPHFVKRSRERTNVKVEKDMYNMIGAVVGNGQYIGETEAEIGGRGHMFAQGRMAIILSLDFREAITIIEYTGNKFAPQLSPVDAPLQFTVPTAEFAPTFVGRLVKFYDGEFKRLDRKERMLTKQLDKLRVEGAVEIAQLNLRIFKTKSSGVKFNCHLKINTINDSIKEAEALLSRIIADKRIIAKARVSVGV